MKSKKMIVAVLSLAMILGTQWLVSAGTVTFNKKYVDSNTYSIVATATKDTYYGYGEVLITNIYKANGAPSDYKQVYCKVYPNGETKLITIAEKTFVDIQIPVSAITPGSNVSLLAMGHNPALDCMVSGYWNPR